MPDQNATTYATGCCNCQCGSAQPHTTRPSLTAGDIKLLSQALQTTSHLAWMVSEGKLAPGNTGSFDCDLLLAVLKATAEGSRAVAEASRARVITSNCTVAPSTIHNQQNQEHNKPSIDADPMDRKLQAPRIVDEIVQVASIGPAIGKVSDCRDLVISTCVGSISRAKWEAMGNEKARELDTVIRRIVGRICSKRIGWDNTGNIIQEELAAFGFRFGTPSKFPPSDSILDWNRAADTSASDLNRIQALSEHCSPRLGAEWYADEMVRVVQQLMELRGFQP